MAKLNDKETIINLIRSAKKTELKTLIAGEGEPINPAT